MRLDAVNNFGTFQIESSAKEEARYFVFRLIPIIALSPALSHGRGALRFHFGLFF